MVSSPSIEPTKFVLGRLPDPSSIFSGQPLVCGWPATPARVCNGPCTDQTPEMNEMLISSKLLTKNLDNEEIKK